MTAALAAYLAHAPITVVAHFAHTTTTNVIFNAASAGSTAGAAGTLYTGARTGYKLAKKVDRIQRREEAASRRSLKNMSDEQRAEVLAVVVLFQLMQGYYESLERTTARASEKEKTLLEEMEPCGRCDCKDYEKNSRRRCSCGHEAQAHATITESQLDNPDSFEWLQRGMAAQVYPLLENRDGDGDVKTRLGQIDACIEAGCPCWDFDRDFEKELFSRRCTCGHRFREHGVTGEWKWIIQLLIIKTLKDIMGEESSSSSSSSDSDSEEQDDEDDDDSDDNEGDDDSDEVDDIDYDWY